MSKAMQSKYKEDPSFIEKIKTYLRTGQSQSPKQIFAQMGIDMEDPLFWKAGLDEQESFLDETIALAKKLGKI